MFLLNPSSYSQFQHLLDLVEYPSKYRPTFTPVPGSTSDTGLLEVLQRFSVDTSVRLQEIVACIGRSLLEHVRFAGQNLYIPDNNTHIIAVLGTTDAIEDSWFLSDFCMLYHTLDGTTAKSESWLTSVNPRDVVANMGRPIRHGSPGNLKTVFDEKSPAFYTQVDPFALSETFLSHIEHAASSAAEGDRIVIIIVSHGNVTGEVGIGLRACNRGPGCMPALVTREDIEQRLAHPTYKLPTTIISTACFSGMWLLPMGRFSDVMAAAPSNDYAWSLLPTSTSGRLNGGNFVQALTEEFGTLAIPQDHSVHAAHAGYIAPGNPRSTITRAISVGDIMVHSIVDTTASGSIGEWAESVKENVRRVTFNLEKKKRSLPVFRFENENLPASMVLGGSEISTLVRAEAVLSLPPVVDADAIPLALGVEDVVVAQSRDLTGQVLQLLKRYLPELGHQTAVPACDTWFAVIQMDIHYNRASNSRLKEAYRLLDARLQADNRAMFVTDYFHPKFTKQQPIERWDGSIQRIISRDETVAFANTLEEFLHDWNENHIKAHYVYYRPLQYVIAAAVDLQLSPQELGVCLGPLSLYSWRFQLSHSSSSGSIGTSGSWDTIEGLEALIQGFPTSRSEGLLSESDANVHFSVCPVTNS